MSKLTATVAVSDSTPAEWIKEGNLCACSCHKFHLHASKLRDLAFQKKEFGNHEAKALGA